MIRARGFTTTEQWFTVYGESPDSDMYTMCGSYHGKDAAQTACDTLNETERVLSPKSPMVYRVISVMKSQTIEYAEVE